MPRDDEFHASTLHHKVCYNSRKVYSQTGTTCHQCRQKTDDLKSRCYSPYCRGGRGQFCGFCLWKRYGEDVAVVLQNPKWRCPPCRKVCNCSICRRRNGKQPTGQLYHFVSRIGYTNVQDYLAENNDLLLSGNKTEEQFDELQPFEDEDYEEGNVVEQWTVEEVIDHICSVDSDLSTVADVFRQHEIDGKAFLLLDSDMMLKHMGLKMGPTLKIRSLISEIRGSD